MTSTVLAAQSPRWVPRLACVLGAVAVVEVCAGVAFTIAVRWSFDEALNAFVVTNGMMGASFAVCGMIIGWHRPRNVVGWLFIGGGLAHATAALMAPLTEWLHISDASVGALRLAVTLFAWSWPWSIALTLPLALLLFPDGRPPSRRWRPAVVAVIATAPLFLLAWGAGPESPPGVPPGYLVLASYDALAPLWTLAEVRTLASLALAVVALVARYRRGSETERRQLLWLVLAGIIVVAVVAPWSFVAGTPILVLLAIPLIPLSVAVAILRHRLLDIRLVVSRAVAWVLLSGAVVVGYAALVTLLDRFVSAQVGRSAAATVVIALLVAPVLPRLQRVVDRVMYGDRRHPARIASKVAEQLVAGPSGLPGVAAAIRRALRMPYVALAGRDGLLAEDGLASTAVQSIDLLYEGERVGDLRVGLRPGERQLGSADREVLDLMTLPLAVALHALNLSTEVQASRERIVAAREEERRRLRRDLHDGLGPTLTGVAFAADAAANLLDADGAKARELISSVRADSRTAIGEVRRLVEDLRPPALDELGLIGALRQRTEQPSWRADGTPVLIELNASEDATDLPAAVEVAAYRIATEAVTNVLRHSCATRAVLTVRCGDTLKLDIVDDGSPRNGAWTPGVGLQAMRERVDELGGRFRAGPTPHGGRVSVSLPLRRA